MPSEIIVLTLSPNNIQKTDLRNRFRDGTMDAVIEVGLDARVLKFPFSKSATFPDLNIYIKHVKICYSTILIVLKNLCNMCNLSSSRKSKLF